MSSEILSVLEYMEKEKGIPRADMIATIVNALKTAALKGINSGQELKIDINPKNGQLHAWAVLKVVDSIGNPKTDIHVEKAQALKPGAVVGDVIEPPDVRQDQSRHVVVVAAGVVVASDVFVLAVAIAVPGGGGGVRQLPQERREQRRLQSVDPQ